MHACIHTYMHACMHAYTHTCMHACMHAYMHTCMHAYIHTYMHACIHTYYIHTCIHTYTHACMHAYTHAYMEVCRRARLPRPPTPRLLRRMPRTLIALALRHALACKGYSVRALGQPPSDVFQEHFGKEPSTNVNCFIGRTWRADNKPMAQQWHMKMLSGRGEAHDKILKQRLQVPRAGADQSQSLRLAFAGLFGSLQVLVQY